MILSIVAITLSVVALAVVLVVASRRTCPLVTDEDRRRAREFKAQLDELEATIQRLTLWTMGGRR